MYVCMYVLFMFVCMYVYVCMCIYVYVCMYICLYVCMHVCMCVGVYMQCNVLPCVCVCACSCNIWCYIQEGRSKLFADYLECQGDTEQTVLRFEARVEDKESTTIKWGFRPEKWLQDRHGDRKAEKLMERKKALGLTLLCNCRGWAYGVCHCDFLWLRNMARDDLWAAGILSPGFGLGLL